MTFTCTLDEHDDERSVILPPAAIIELSSFLPVPSAKFPCRPGILYLRIRAITLAGACLLLHFGGELRYAAIPEGRVLYRAAEGCGR